MTIAGIVNHYIYVAKFFNGLVAEFHTANYGEEVKAKVINVSRLCDLKRKYVTLLIEGNPKRIRLYGLSCRKNDFPLNGQVTVRVNRRLNIITVPHNAGIPRLISFPFMTILVTIASILAIKHRRKLPE